MVLSERPEADEVFISKLCDHQVELKSRQDLYLELVIHNASDGDKMIPTINTDKSSNLLVQTNLLRRLPIYNMALPKLLEGESLVLLLMLLYDEFHLRRIFGRGGISKSLVSLVSKPLNTSCHIM